MSTCDSKKKEEPNVGPAEGNRERTTTRIRKMRERIRRVECR
jgi:hypothetical protein